MTQIHTLYLRQGAFTENSIETVNFTSGEVNLGSKIFYGNPLKNVSFGVLMGYMDEGMLYTRLGNQLKSIEIDSNNPRYTSGNNNNILYDSSTNSLLAVTNGTGVQQGTEIVGNYALADSGLTSLDNLDNIRKIGFNSFEGNNFNSVVFDQEVVSIGDNAFKNAFVDGGVFQMAGTDTIYGDGVFDSDKVIASGITLIAQEGSTTEQYSLDNGHTFVTDTIPNINMGNYKGGWYTTYITHLTYSNVDVNKDVQYAITTLDQFAGGHWVDVSDDNIDGNGAVQQIVFEKTGEFILHARAFGLDGHLIYITSDIIQIDRDKSIYEDYGKEQAILDLSFYDEHSGIKQITLPNGDTQVSDHVVYKVTENGDYLFIAEDNAGNKTEIELSVDTIIASSNGEDGLNTDSGVTIEEDGGNNEETNDGESSTEDGDRQVLPKTATTMHTVLLIGLVLLVAGISLVIDQSNRKLKTTNE